MLIDGDPEPSLRNLAKRVGVSPMALYRYFPSKVALLAAVADAGFRSLCEKLVGADQSSSEASESLIAQGMAYVRFASSVPNLYRLMFSDRAAETCQSRWRAEAFALLARRVAIVAHADLHGGTLACWAVVHGLAMLQLSSSRPIEVSEVRQALGVIVRGIEG